MRTRQASTPSALVPDIMPIIVRSGMMVILTRAPGLGQTGCGRIIKDRRDSNMSDQEKMPEPSKEPQEPKGATATKQRPVRKPPKPLPLWKVLLHNDDKNSMDHVISSIVELTPLNVEDATLRMKEADKTGVALILVTHKERAELYQEQFQSKSLTVTIEPAE